MSAVVGNVDSMIIKMVNQLGDHIETTVTNKRLFVNRHATYQDADTFARALQGLTKNTYEDTDLITVISVNEKLAEE